MHQEAIIPGFCSGRKETDQLEAWVPEDPNILLSLGPRMCQPVFGHESSLWLRPFRLDSALHRDEETDRWWVLF